MVRSRQASGDANSKVHAGANESAGAGKPAHAMSFRSVVFMLALIVAMTASLIYYIGLQADVTESSRQIADLEQELSEKKAQNDADYNEISDRISLEEIRDKAMNELGMKYADRDQIVQYSGTEESAVKQMTDNP